ncbi:uncharacterized protein CPUR_05805 [Claviceps purpurea 20.1]|uniref:Uncharacterized protein n=1 Tax=Claviceps purpurea (strain 20.1) TaxID=1111077 RepID=M1WD25_CLAP2|nr:uncharacterized protein CPUR_05805 [Claviceps purpurea 20.1]
MGGVNAVSTVTDVVAQIAALASQNAALQSNASGRRGISSRRQQSPAHAVTWVWRRLRAQGAGQTSTKGALRAERAAVWRAGAGTREAGDGGGGRENYANMAW